MNLETSGRMSSITPIMAQLGDIDKLYDLARDRSAEARSELASTVSAILESDLPVHQAEQVADILISLLRQAERDMRQVLAEKLSVLDDVPLRLILQLANDEIEIAAPVLSQSCVLSEYDLLYIIKSKPAEYWREIAKREDLCAQVIDVLSDTGDFSTAYNLVENNAIELTQHAVSSIAALAESSEALAMPLLRRQEATRDLATHLYNVVGNEIKSFISENYELDIETVNEQIDLAAETLAEAQNSHGFMPEAYMVSAARNFKEKEILNVGLMLTTLRRGHIRSFVAQFSVFTGLSCEIIIQMLSQTNGQGLAVAAKATNIEKQDFVSIFMLTSKIWNYGRMVDVTDIKTAIDYFNRATPEIAREILKSKRQNQ